MAVTPSNMLPLGTPAPDFQLPDTISRKTFDLHELKSNKGTVIVFMCNHCPFVKHILPRMVEVARTYQQKGIQFIAINSNDVKHYPDDAPEKMKELAQQLKFPFPYLFDETQEVAHAYKAACTPDFYLFDKDLKCVYRGRFDASTPGNDAPITGSELCAAMDNLLNGKDISDKQQASMGCNIKWKR
jgi:peroxiredoxin